MRIVIPIAILVGCRHHPAAPAITGPATELAAQATASGSASGPVGKVAFDQLGPDQRPVLARVVFDARDVIASATFHRTLARLDELYVSPGGGWWTGDLVDLVYGGGSHFNALPVCYQAKSPERALVSRIETAATGIEDRCGSRKTRFAVTQLHAVVLDQADQLPEGRACAINTLAHEWTHSIVNDDHDQVFKDGGYKAFDVPYVSYAVGAVAQCVYLQRWQPDLDLDACVHAAGTHAFGHCTCEPGWLEEFMAGNTTCK